jgi:hypothetical protein
MGSQIKRLNSDLAKSACCFCVLACCFMLASVVAFGQDDDELAPPPVKVITKEERTRLDGESDTKTRTKIAVDLMRSRVDAAEKLFAQNNFDGIFNELGHFRGLLDYTLAFLQKQNHEESRTLDNYKRLELTLRAATPRIETLRREMPSRYEEYIRLLLIYVREARAKAVEPMFDDTVLPEK